MNVHKAINIICCALLICLSSSITQAQLFVGSKNKASDVELWNGIEISKEVTKKIDVSFTYQLRFNKQVQRFKSTFAQFGVTFPIKKIHKNIKISPNIRLIRNFDKEFIKRPFLDVGTRLFKSDKITLGYKMRFQKDFQHFSKNEFDVDFYWRNRLTLNFNQISQNEKLKDLEPYLGVILFTRVYNKGTQNDQLRILAGINYKVKKRQSVRIGYIYRERFNVSRPSISHIISLKMDFEMKDFKK